ncbi:TPA: hypothetical protein ACKPX2_000037 [Stenotrophomonas maltophilia]
MKQCENGGGSDCQVIFENCAEPEFQKF